MTYDLVVKYENSNNDLSSISIVERANGEGQYRRRKKALEDALGLLVKIYNHVKDLDTAYYYIDGKVRRIDMRDVDNNGFEDIILANEHFEAIKKRLDDHKDMGKSGEKTDKLEVEETVKAAENECDIAMLEARYNLLLKRVEKIEEQIAQGNITKPEGEKHSDEIINFKPLTNTITETQKPKTIEDYIKEISDKLDRLLNKRDDAYDWWDKPWNQRRFAVPTGPTCISESKDVSISLNGTTTIPL